MHKFSCRYTSQAIPSIAEKTDNPLLQPNEDIAEATPKPEEKHEEPAAMRDISLYFMYIDATGNLIRKETHRSIPATSSPLTATLQTLLANL